MKNNDTLKTKIIDMILSIESPYILDCIYKYVKDAKEDDLYMKGLY